MRGAPAGSAGDKRSTLLVVVGMGLVFLVALGVILYFALATGSEGGDSGGGDEDGAGEVSGVNLRSASPPVDLEIAPAGAPGFPPLTFPGRLPAG